MLLLSGKTGTCEGGSLEKVYTLVTTESQLENILKDEPPQILLYRNIKNFNCKEIQTLQDVLTELVKVPNAMIDVQDMGRKEGDELKTYSAS